MNSSHSKEVFEDESLSTLGAGDLQLNAGHTYGDTFMNPREMQFHALFVLSQGPIRGYGSALAETLWNDESKNMRP